jgi:predicted Zn-dependent peptidase
MILASCLEKMMSEINRAVAPPISAIESVTLPDVEQITLDNGIKVFAIPDQRSEVVKLELIFKAGKWYEPHNLVANLASRMLREGTQSKAGKELADFFDFYGSNFNTSAGSEIASVSIYCLSKFLSVQMPVLFEVITQSAFPESELSTVITNRKQRLAVELEKNDFLSNREFVQAIWGPTHPFGRITQMNDFDKINSHDLKEFVAAFYNANNCFVLLAGNYNLSVLSEINKIFGQPDWKGSAAPKLTHQVVPQTEKSIHLEKANSVQSAIQVGNVTLQKTHPDFIHFTVANTVFGGYFGSRLMSNIREEKGYTYGIHSSIVSFPSGSYLDISSEVGKEVRQATFDEIEKEMKLMQTELVDENELETVKNYMSGKILRGVDGSIRFSETLKSLLLHEQDESYIHHLLKNIRQTTAEDVLRVCKQYLNFDEMYKVSVG